MTTMVLNSIYIFDGVQLMPVFVGYQVLRVYSSNSFEITVTLDEMVLAKGHNNSLLITATYIIPGIDSEYQIVEQFYFTNKEAELKTYTRKTNKYVLV